MPFQKKSKKVWRISKCVCFYLFVYYVYVSRFWSINNTNQIRPPTNLYLLIAYFKQIKKKYEPTKRVVNAPLFYLNTPLLYKQTYEIVFFSPFFGNAWCLGSTYTHLGQPFHTLTRKCEMTSRIIGKKNRTWDLKLEQIRKSQVNTTWPTPWD